MDESVYDDLKGKLTILFNTHYEMGVITSCHRNAQAAAEAAQALIALEQLKINGGLTRRSGPEV